MPVTLNLKRGIDLPVYQWLRFLPVTSAAGASMCTDVRGTNRFIYMLLGAANFWRYDTWTDSYQQLASPPSNSFAAGVSLAFDASRGAEGYVWLTAALTASPWHMFAYYDVAANTWTSRAAVSGLAAAFGTDADLCHTCSTYNAAGNDDYVYLIGNNSTTWYRFSITGNAWTAFTGAQLLPAAAGAGCSLMWAFGYNTDRLYYIRGTATAALYKFTISTSAWSADTTYGYKFETFTTGTVVAYDSLNRIYIVKDATHRIYYYQLDEDKLYVGGMFPYVSGTGIVGDGFVYIKTLDGAEYLCYRRHTGTEFWRMLIGWF
jgi:hypothetical protein